MDPSSSFLVCAVGALYIDTIIDVPSYPDEDSKTRATSLSIRPGGNTINSLRVLAQLIPPTERMILCTSLPSPSVNISQARDYLAPITVVAPCHHSGHDTLPTSMIIRSKASDSRTILSHNVLPDLTLEKFNTAFPPPLIQKVQWWHFEGRNIPNALEFVKRIRVCTASAGDAEAPQISVEVEKPSRPGLRDLAAVADVVFYSRSWASVEGYVDAKACLLAEAAWLKERGARARLLCCTWGSEGGFALDLSNSSTMEVVASPATEVTVREDEIRDPIGAGDTWIAGMIYGLTCHGEDSQEDPERKKWSLGRMLQFANSLATCKIRQEGFDGLGRAMSEMRL